MSVNEISIKVEKEIVTTKKATITIADIVKILKESATNTLNGYCLYENEVELDADSYGTECTVTINTEQADLKDKIDDIFSDGELLIEEFLDEQYNAKELEDFDDKHKTTTEVEAKKTAAKKNNEIHEEGENGLL